MKIKWLDANLRAMMCPGEPKGDVLLISGDDLSEFKEWLTGDLARKMNFNIIHTSRRTKDSHETIILKFLSSEYDASINNKIARDLAAIKTAWQTTGNVHWSKGLPEPAA